MQSVPGRDSNPVLLECCSGSLPFYALFHFLEYGPIFYVYIFYLYLYIRGLASIKKKSASTTITYIVIGCGIARFV